jgi:hypothetical protein
LGDKTLYTRAASAAMLRRSAAHVLTGCEVRLAPLNEAGAEKTIPERKAIEPIVARGSPQQ